MESATVYMAGGPDAAERLKEAMSGILSALDERPGSLAVRFRTEEGCGGAEIGLDRGEPVFSAPGCAPARGRCRKRWIAEHPVPVHLENGSFLVFQSVDGGRVRVRPPTAAERIFG